MDPLVTGPHLVVLSKTFPPAAFPEAHVTAKVVYGLLHAGARVTVITSDEWGDRHTRLEQRLSHPQLRVLRTKYVRSRITRIPIHLACALTEWAPIGPAHFVRTGKRAFRQTGHAPDLIYARGLPSHGYFLGEHLAREFGAPLVLHLADPWPKWLWPSPYRNRPDPAEVWETWASAGPQQRAAAWTVPSRRLCEHLRRNLPLLRAKPCMLYPHPAPCWEPEAVPGFLDDRVEGRLELVHAGSLDPARNPRGFLLGVRDYLSRYPGRIRLTLLGGAWEQLPGMLHSLNLTGDVRSVPAFDYLETLTALRHSDALLLLEAPVAEGIFLPSKFPDYCWAGRPILAVCPKQGETADYLGRLGQGVIAPHASPAQIAHRLEKFYAGWRDQTVPDASGLNADFDGPRLTCEFLAFIRPLLGPAWRDWTPRTPPSAWGCPPSSAALGG